VRTSGAVLFVDRAGRRLDRTMASRRPRRWHRSDTRVTARPPISATTKRSCGDARAGGGGLDRLL